MEQAGGFEDTTQTAQRDMQRILVEYIPHELRDRGGESAPVRVLSVAAGVALEAMPIQNIFTEVVYKAIDSDPDQVDAARAFNYEMPENNFVLGDATKLGEEQGKWDLVVLRNPMVSTVNKLGDGEKGDSNWEKILESSVRALKPGGSMIITALEMEELVNAVGFVTREEGFKLSRGPEMITKPITKDYPYRETSVAAVQRLVK